MLLGIKIKKNSLYKYHVSSKKHVLFIFEKIIIMDCIKGTDKITSDIIQLLGKLDNTSYKQPLEIFNGSSLGQHFRHILDFYNCLVRDEAKGLIDYASRERDPKVEVDTAVASAAFLNISAKVHQMDIEQTIQVKADFSEIIDKKPVVQSSLGRELMFAYDHALHHLAMIKIGLQTNFPHICIDEKLGVAPSTLKFQKGSAAPSETNA